MKPEPLAQVEVLLLFHPSMQSGGPARAKPDQIVNASQGHITLDVYGRRARGEFSGKPILEDMRLEVDGEDIEAKLPDNIVNDIADYVLGEA